MISLTVDKILPCSIFGIFAELFTFSSSGRRILVGENRNLLKRLVTDHAGLSDNVKEIKIYFLSLIKKIRPLT